MEQRIWVERKIAALFYQEPYSRCAIASGICEAIHAITIQKITHCILRNFSGAAGRCSGQLPTIPTLIDLGDLACDAYREGATRPKVDGRAADRQLQGSDRQARDQGAAQHLPSCPNRMMTGIAARTFTWLYFICVLARYVERSAFSSNVGVSQCQRRIRILIPSMIAARCCAGSFLPGSVLLPSSCSGASG